MVPQLTNNTVNRILEGEKVEKPIVQLLGWKQAGSGTDKFRMLVSDGKRLHPYSIIGTQLNDRLQNGDFEKYTVVRLTNYICNTVSPEKKILLILDMEVLERGEDLGKKLGEISVATMDSNFNGIKQDRDTPMDTTNEQPPPQRKPNPTPSVAQSNSVSSSFYGAKANTNGNQGFGSNKPLNSGHQGIGPKHSNPETTAANNIHPISSLTPYQNKWTIRVRVTKKTQVRTWSNSKGEGKLFSMDLCDESGEIRATAFKNECDKFFDMINENDVYYISKAVLKTANKQYSSIKNDYELTFNGETTVVSCMDSVTSIPMQVFDFKSIADLQSIEPGTTVDLIAICKTFGDVQNLTSKAGKELKKRDLQLVDKSNMEITLTMWDTMAESFDGSSVPVLAIKGCRLSDYGGRSLSLNNSSSLSVNPDIREAHVLRGWYEQEGVHAATISVTTKFGGAGGGGTNWKTFAQVKAEQLGSGEKPDYYSCKATVMMVKKDNCMYQACPSEGCSKKVMDLQNGQYRCDKCQKEFGEFKWRLLISMNLADFTDNVWVTAFQENGEIMLGYTARELGTMKDSNEEEFQEVIGQLNFKTFTFKLRAKMETYNEESRIKTIITTATPWNFREYSRKLIKDMKEIQTAMSSLTSP